MESTPLVAFDQHAATTVAAVLLPGELRARAPFEKPVRSSSVTD
jgi:hypothetical protein